MKREPKKLKVRTPADLVRDLPPMKEEKPSRVPSRDKPPPPAIRISLLDKLRAAFEYYLDTLIRRGSQGKDVPPPLPLPGAFGTVDKFYFLIIGGSLLALLVYYLLR